VTARNSDAPVLMAQCQGLWRRTLLVDTDGSQDISTDVRWLQGRTRFVDLRRPTPRPDFGGTAGAADLTAQQRGWLRMQDGFAGELTQRGNIFHWQRHIAMQPPGPFPDEGAMSYSDGILVETGVHADYFEHWILDAPTGECWAMDLESGSGDRALLLRVGELFGWAHRDAAGAVELSLGAIAGNEWVITDSALPYREGHALAPSWDTQGKSLHTNAIDAQGTPITREWLVGFTEGNVTF